MPNLSFYTGYSTGAFVNIATESTAISTKPETSKQVEIGSKMSLLNNKLDVNAALFKTQRENYFITLPGALSPTPDGQDETTGLELDVSARPMSGLTLTGNAVWMDPEVKSNTLASNAIMGVVNQSIQGNMPAGVSRRTASLWANYTLQGGVANGLTLGLGANYKDYSYADSLNLYRVPSYLVFDAAVTYRQPKWEAAVTLKNLTDKVYYTNATFVGALPGDPRSVYATLRFDY
jgi:iron complex outermembrane receptor protein